MASKILALARDASLLSFRGHSHGCRSGIVLAQRPRRKRTWHQSSEEISKHVERVTMGWRPRLQRPPWLSLYRKGFPLPKGWSISIQAERSQRSGPQSCVLRRGQERLCAAARLLLAKWLAAKRVALRVQPKTVPAAKEAVIVEVAGTSVRRLNTDKSHHVTLCRCGGTACKPGARPGCGRKESPAGSSPGTCASSAQPGASKGSRDCCRSCEKGLEERSAIEPDQRGPHVSL